jgi:alkylated DNA nucleotide flippase Atl1
MSTRKNVDRLVRFHTPADMRTVPTSQMKRKILRDGARANEVRDTAFRRVILSIPAGKVSTYGRVAAAAGYPLYHRAVARLLRTDPPDHLPWHRVQETGSSVSEPFIAEVNLMLVQYPSRIALHKKGTKLERRTVFEPQRPEDVWAPLAAATVELLSDVEPSRIRKCESCVVHFRDTSKKGSRRWCSMNICGNRLKVAAYQHRNRAARA